MHVTEQDIEQDTAPRRQDTTTAVAGVAAAAAAAGAEKPKIYIAWTLNDKYKCLTINTRYQRGHGDGAGDGAEAGSGAGDGTGAGVRAKSPAPK